MQKADYSKIASSYDKGRYLSEQIYDLWLDIISRLAGKKENARLLDLGCGTGRFAIPTAKKLKYKVTGADLSKEMLEKAKEKDNGGLVRWELQDAQNLTYPDNSFDIVFMSFLLHHCDETMRVIQESWRVLRDGGVILIRHAGIEQIRDDIEHTFFPETLALDNARIYSVKKLENCLKAAGFSNIVSEEIIQTTFPTGKARFKAILSKNTSVLTMISHDAYEQGVKKLKDYIASHPDDPWLLCDKMTITAGYKSKTTG